MKLADQHFACLLLLLTQTHRTASPSVPQHCQPQSWYAHDSSSTADSDDEDVFHPSFPTDAAATAASTSSSPAVTDCCEVCLLVRRLSALWTFVFLFDVC